MDTNKTAVIFSRVSTEQQAGDKWSLSSQFEFNKKYAKAHQLEVLRTWSIVESGSRDEERKEFRSMLAFIEENHIENLVVLNTERLTRSHRGMVDLDDLSRDFLTIHFTESGETISKATPGDKRAFWAVKVAFSRLYIDDLEDKARRSYEARFDKGLYASNCPLGYRSKNSHLTPDPIERPFIIRAFELYADGTESLVTLADKLFAEGFRTRRGKRVSDTTLSAMLNNPLYLGYVLWPFEESKYVSTPHFKGEKIKGQHESIINQDVFDRVQQVFAEKGRPHSKVKRFYVYRGIFKCGVCKRIMSGYEAGGHNYYTSSHPHGSRCKQVKCYREEELTKQLEKALSRFSFPADLSSWMREMIRETNSEQRDSSQAELKSLADERKRLEARIDNALDEALAGIFDRMKIQAKVSEYRERLAQIEKQVSRIDNGRGEAVDQGLLLLDLVQDLPRAFAQASPEQKNRLLKVVFKESVVRDGRFEFRANEPFSALFEIDPTMAGKQGFEP